MRQNPNDCDAQVAAAVAHFDKDRLGVSAFSRLGPLTRKFPKCQTVRYYLAIAARLDAASSTPALEQFEKTVAMAPNTERGRAAAQLLNDVRGGGGGTGSSTK